MGIHLPMHLVGLQLDEHGGERVLLPLGVAHKSSCTPFSGLVRPAQSGCAHSTMQGVQL